MTEVTVSLKDIEALKESLKPGDKVTHSTPIAKFFGEDNVRGNRILHKGKIVKKLQHLAIIEYNAKRGNKDIIGWKNAQGVFDWWMEDKNMDGQFSMDFEGNDLIGYNEKGV